MVDRIWSCVKSPELDAFTEVDAVGVAPLLSVNKPQQKQLLNGENKGTY